MAVPFPGDRRRPVLDGWLPGAVLLLVGLFLGWNRWVEHRELTRAEGERLAVQLRAADENLSRQLIGAHVALLGLREDVLRWGPEERLATAGRRLQVLADAMPGVRTITLHDADGRVSASSRDEPSGTDAADRLSLRSARAGADPTLLYVSPPYRSAAGVYATRLTLWVLDADGRFDGTVTATLDPEYFGLVLRSLLYAPDMRATLTHGDGSTVVAMPPEESAPAASDGPRLVVQQSLRAAAVPMDRPLLLAVSRDRAAMMAPWAAQTRLFAALYVALVAGTGGALWLQRRRQRELQALATEQEARQRADAERLQRALQGADLGLWDLDLRTRSAAVDARWAAMLGYAPHDAPGEEAGWKALLHPDDRGRVIRAQEDHIAGRSEAFEAVYRLRHRDGHWIWVLDRGKVLERDAAGVPLRMVGTHMDISARMRDQEALQRSEQNLAITLDSIGEAVIATDAGGRVTRMNPAAERLTGWSAQQAIGHALADVYRRVAARTRVPLPDPVAQVLARSETVDGGDDVLLLARDGRELRVADSVSPIRAPSGEVQGVVLVGSDVTERERVQRALHERELQLSRVTDALPGPVVRLSRSGHCLFVNRAYERWFGVRAVDVAGRLQREVLDAANAAAVEAAEPLRRVRAGETVQFEAPLHSADGGLRHTLVTLVPDRDTDGGGRGHFAVFTDITERRQSEARLRAAQDELEAVLAALPDLLFEVGLDGFIHRFHSPRSELLYMPPEDFLGRRVSEVLPPGALEVVQAALAQAYREGHSNGQQYALDLPHGRRCFELSVALKALDPAEGPRLVVLARDVTERNQAAAERLSLERQLREAQKMESIGTLAGGIAHDFNNIVAAILGNVALLREDLAREHPAQHGLEQVQRAGLRARTLVQQILAFSRRQPQDLRSQPLQPVVEETLALLRVTLPATVRLQARLAPAPLSVAADATQMQQVLLNLCTNAWHALPEDGGQVIIGLGVAELDPQSDARLAGLQHGVHAHLWVADDGCGIEPAARERIFDPFYTTKPAGQGTGLGLAVVHGIVRSHRGAITVDSAPGRGSRFDLYFPLAPADERQSRTAVAAAPPAVPAGRGQHVLYVDDDEVMAVLVERLLQRTGYAATVCRTAQQALELVLAQPRRFELLVTDYNMPGLSGLELCRQVAALCPGLPRVITSGHVSAELRAQALHEGVLCVLHKEHTVDELPALLHALLAPEGTAADP